MKPNEAPEKIFLEWYRIGDKKYSDWCITPKTNNEPIQYVRTDAFIEKAVNYMNNHLPIITTNIALSDERYATILKEKCIEDFRNYMEGE